jgi:hypothetical protein
LVPLQHNPIAVCTTRENDRRRRSRAVPGHSIRVRGCAAVGPAAMHEWFSPFVYGCGPHLCSCSCAAAQAGLLLRLPRTTRPSAQAGPPRPRYPVLVPDPIPAQNPEFTQKKHPPRLRMLFQETPDALGGGCQCARLWRACACCHIASTLLSLLSHILPR